MRHHFEDREATVAGFAELVSIPSRPIRRRNKIALAIDLDALLQVSLVGEYLFKPADIAQCYRGSIITDCEMVMRLAWRCVRPAAANETGPNSSDFELTKAHWALLGAAHSANARSHWRPARDVRYGNRAPPGRPVQSARWAKWHSKQSFHFSGHEHYQRQVDKPKHEPELRRHDLGDNLNRRLAKTIPPRATTAKWQQERRQGESQQQDYPERMHTQAQR